MRARGSGPRRGCRKYANGTFVNCDAPLRRYALISQYITYPATTGSKGIPNSEASTAAMANTPHDPSGCSSPQMKSV